MHMRAVINNELIIRRMNIKNHLYALSPLIVFTLVIASGVYFLYQKYGMPEGTILVLIVFLYSIFALPAIFLHIEYIINDCNVSFTIDIGKKQIIYNKDKRKIIFKFDEIEEIQFFGEIKDFNNLTTQNYSYYYFKVQNNTSFIITSLVIRNIDRVLTKASIIKNRRLFPSILFEDKINTR